MISRFNGGGFRAAKILSPDVTERGQLVRKLAGWARKHADKLSALRCVLLTLALLISPRSFAETNSPAAILQELKSFREMGSVLYVAAHPDDENTQLITFLARGKNYRTAYLSLTRGDGGQNVLGGEFGEQLGYIRTEELLAARRLDGGQQFFTRAMDFGFSKDYRETVKIWDREQVVADIVRVIRTFRPDVVITRFSTQPGGTHGHHTASAVLALEAFKLAGDPKNFPEQNLMPWSPKRIFTNGRGGGGADSLPMDISGNDPVSGEPFGAIAGRSRAMHKSQGFGNFGGGGGGARSESFQLLAGETATNDILDGVDTTWNRIPGGAEIVKQADEIIGKFDTNNAEASVNALLKLRTKTWNFLLQGQMVKEKCDLLDKIIQSCLGLSVVTTVPHAEVVPGEKVKLRSTVTVRSKIPVRWLKPMQFHPKELNDTNAITLVPNQAVSREIEVAIPELSPTSQLTQPYWLREEPKRGMYQVDDSAFIGDPENPPVMSLSHFFEVGGQVLGVADEPCQAETEAGKFEERRRLEVIPPVSLDFSSEVKFFAPGSTRQVEIEITAARANSSGTLKLNAPADWKIFPASQPFQLTSIGEKKKFIFNVAAPEKPASADFTASAQIGGATFNTKRIEISYKHIPHLLLQPQARMKAASFDIAIRGKKVGYIPGAGDSVADALKEMGYEVSLLTGADLTTNRLKDFDAVVIGIRAFNVRTDLVSHMPDLFAFVEAGGNVIAQYNRPGNDLKTDKLAPYNLKLSGDRVTDENATMTFLAPEHPVLNTPNKITAADFDGWVQERGIYFPNQWDEHFTPILACNDAGEKPLNGALLVAPYGKGNFIYTGLVFFRELPAGVPGTYRLFANLVSLGK